MLNKIASLDLVDFVEKNILPEYQNFDKAHSTAHVTRVIRNSLNLANAIGADINMAYVVAAYHDLGMSGPRAVHHITGGKILATDARLKRWFSTEQLKIMREAIEDHRDEVFRRCIQFGLANYPQLDKESQWKRFLEHLNNKYSVNGYIKLWIPQSDNARKLRELREMMTNHETLRRVFDKIYDEETGE